MAGCLVRRLPHRLGAQEVERLGGFRSGLPEEVERQVQAALGIVPLRSGPVDEDRLLHSRQVLHHQILQQRVPQALVVEVVQQQHPVGRRVQLPERLPHHHQPGGDVARHQAEQHALAGDGDGARVGVEVGGQVPDEHAPDVGAASQRHELHHRVERQHRAELVDGVPQRLGGELYHAVRPEVVLQKTEVHREDALPEPGPRTVDAEPLGQELQGVDPAGVHQVERQHGELAVPQPRAAEVVLVQEHDLHHPVLVPKGVVLQPHGRQVLGAEVRVRSQRGHPLSPGRGGRAETAQPARHERRQPDALGRLQEPPGHDGPLPSALRIPLSAVQTAAEHALHALALPREARQSVPPALQDLNLRIAVELLTPVQNDVRAVQVGVGAEGQEIRREADIYAATARRCRGARPAGIAGPST